MGSFNDPEFQHEISQTGFEFGRQAAIGEVDDDGKPKRTGTVWTAGAHIITAVVGAGVLSLAWSVAQLGWIFGISIVLIFAAITLYTANLLADCYRSPDPVTGKRNYTYMEAVQNILGGGMYVACGWVQNISLTGFVIGYTVTTSTSMVAIRKSNCFHKRGHEAGCKFSNNPYMIALGILEIFLSQIPNFHELSWLSILAAVMSFGYAGIGIGLSITRIISGQGGRTSITGVEVGVAVSQAEKIWRVCTALGNIALACSYAQISIDIQDTLKSSPPENKVMKKANMIGISTMTIFFLMCGCLGYAAFGNDTRGNMLTGFGFYEPFWLVDLGNVMIVVHLVGAYQVLAQPVFRVVELWASMRLIWRTIFVVMVTVLAMAMPFFNEMLALLGAIGFWPLGVYFPVEMYIAQKKIGKRTIRWFGLQILNFVCLIVSLAAGCGAIQGMNKALHTTKPFQFKE
uniref:Amino acid transporter transmembrane domain-containing protein n=1 Tax=Fagus sylvatica TaxID=28930 RepID=A0A2N9I5B8_FAGSY